MENFGKPSAQKHFCSYIPYIMNKSQIFVTLGVLKFFPLEHSSSISPDKVQNRIWVCCSWRCLSGEWNSSSGRAAAVGRQKCRTPVRAAADAPAPGGWNICAFEALLVLPHLVYCGGFMIICVLKRPWSGMDVNPLKQQFWVALRWTCRSPSPQRTRRFAAHRPRRRLELEPESFSYDPGVNTPAKYWST